MTNEDVDEIIQAFDSIDTVTETDSENPLTDEEMDILNKAVEEAHQEIPLNSNTLLIDESTSRFSSAMWYENIQKKNIIFAGIGGIGSWTVLLLARVKPASLYLYDNDIVEYANMSGQLYSQSDIGLHKVTALSQKIKNYANYNTVFAIKDMFTIDSEASDIMMCGFDNMEARSIFFHKWFNHLRLKSEEDRKKCLYIDARLAAEEFQILCIRGDDDYNIHRYRTEFIFLDSEADETLCSYKQTSFCANMIASYIVNLFVNFCANEVGAYRELPFFITYNAETMYLRTEA